MRGVDNTLEMRMRAIDDVNNPRCLNYPKSHLWGLPDIPKDKFVPDYPGESRAGLVIFVLFQTDKDDGTLEHHAVRSACWARRSWLLFTDVIEMDIACKFYVEDSVSDRVFPILEASSIDVEKNVILFDGDPFMPDNNDFFPHCGKKVAMYDDQRFAEYDWVLQADSDMFVASPQRKRLRIFEFLRKHPRTLGMLNAFHGPVGETLDNFQFHLWPRIPAEQWFNRVRDLADEDLADLYRVGHKPIMRTHGALQFFPACEFMSNQMSDCEFIVSAGKRLLNDEAAFSLWSMYSELPIWSYSSHFRTHQESTGDIEVLAAELNDLQSTRDYVMDHGNGVYMSHVNFPHEWLWRWDIDAL